jgi:hypothetical protein
MNALAALLLAATATTATSAAPNVRIHPMRFHRGLPHAFHDQAVASLTATAPPSEILEHVRVESMGDLSYALVASKAGPQAPRVEISAVAVNGRHAWSLDASTAASSYPALRAAVMSALRALSAPYVPAPAELTLRGAGRVIPLTAAGSSDLLWDVEVLIASCSVRVAAPPPPARPALELRVRYTAPRDLGLDRLEGIPVAIEVIHIVVEPESNRGWPVQSIQYGGGEMGLGKCDGGATLRLVCRDELRGQVPKSVTASCPLLER